MNATMSKSPRILIVDDETKNIQLLGTLLKQKGYLINVAQNGQEALDTVREILPDIILLDIMMPALNGFEVCKRLKCDPETKDIPVIFLTGKADAEDIVRGFELGAVDYVTKPFKAVELLARVKTHLNLRLTEASLRESEERFRRLVEYGADPIFVQDFNGNILLANKLACESLGYSYEKLLSMNMNDIEKPDQSHEYAYREKLSEDSPLLIETQYIRKDGYIFPVEERRVQIQLDGKKVIVVFARDIQSRKKMEEERLRIKKLESVAILSGGIAHDYNNLLSIILGNVSLIEEEMDDDGMLELLKEVEEAAFRAADLTRELIIFSKGGKPIKKLASFRKIITELLSSMPTIQGIKYEMHLDEDLMLSEFDADQMKQALKKLIINANEAMPQGGDIRVSANNLVLDKKESRPGISLEPGKYIEIRIQDEGIGIPEAHLPNIFDPYFSTKERGTQKGMGLGLAIVSSIIKKHNGYLSVESEVNKGTQFSIYLSANDNIPKTKVGAPALCKSTNRIAGKILVMEDEVLILKMLEYSLKKMGYEVETSFEGRDAIDRYKRAMDSGTPFDMVILDLIILNGMGGKETIKQLISIDPGVKAIVSSAYYDDPVMANFREHGFCDVLSKPYDTWTLKEAVNSVMC